MQANKKQFIKTHNSPVFLCDYAKSLEEEHIPYNCGDTGIYVAQEYYTRAKQILAELEDECIN